MEFAITQVPAWLSVLFMLSFVSPVLLIARVVKTTYYSLRSDKAITYRNRVVLFYFVFLSLVALVSLSGFFMKNTFPPRIIVCVVLPLLFFYLLVLQRTNWFKDLFKHVKLEQLVSIHLFRFVGIFFFLIYSYDTLPQQFAFVGGGGDILTALLAIVLIYALRKKAKWAIPFAWVWNIIGLLDIASVLVNAIYFTRIAIENNTAGVQQFGTFPFSWIPAFAPATIIFLHVITFKKLRQLKG